MVATVAGFLNPSLKGGDPARAAFPVYWFK
jgi:hypothetical protein